MKSSRLARPPVAQLLASVASFECSLSAMGGDGCWNAATDFSSAQGANDWWYGYQESSGPFQLMTEYDVQDSWTVDWEQPAPQYWTQIRPNLTHPNGTTTSGGRTPVDHEAVLRWVSPIGDTVIVSGWAAKENTLSGNGVD